MKNEWTLPPWFWLRVKKPANDNANSCWLWTGARDRDGYGQARLEADCRIPRYVHRASLTEKLGRPIAPGMQANHTCHNRACVNPEHLYEGTQADNMADRDRADRQAKGEHNGRAKLTRGLVSDIKQAVASGSMRKCDLARLYGVDSTTIRDIAKGKIWKEVA